MPAPNYQSTGLARIENLEQNSAGRTTSGIPTSGAYQKGDWVISNSDGRVFICTTAGSPGTWADAAADPLMKGLSLLAWNFSPFTATSNLAPTSQLLYAVPVPTFAGVTYTGVTLDVSVVGTSTAPTGFYVGLCSYVVLAQKGTMLAQSDNLNASASLTTNGPQQFPFNATFTETASGFRVVLILKNGAFSGTDVTLGRSAAATVFGSANGANWLSATGGSSVTALQANGNLLATALTATSPVAFWAGLY